MLEKPLAADFEGVTIGRMKRAEKMDIHEWVLVGTLFFLLFLLWAV